MAPPVVISACVAACLLVVGMVSGETVSLDSPKSADLKPAPALPSYPSRPPPVSEFGPHPLPPTTYRSTSCPRGADERRGGYDGPSPGLPPRPYVISAPIEIEPPVLTPEVVVERNRSREKRRTAKDEESSEADKILSETASRSAGGDGSKTVDRNITQLLEGVTARDVDLCFLVDVTGSMQSYIDGVRDAIFDIVESLTNTTDGTAVTDLRMAFVGYRDFGDGEEDHFTVLDFTRDVETFHRFVSSTPATGGGDTPEDVHGGLDRALRLEWGSPSRTRLVFHMADAAGHGCDLHQHSTDEFPSGDPKNRTLEDLFAKLERMKIEYAFGNITSDTAIMVDAFAEARNDTIKTFDLGFPRGRTSSEYDGAYYYSSADGSMGAPGAAAAVKSKILESVKTYVRESVSEKESDG